MSTMLKGIIPHSQLDLTASLHQLGIAIMTLAIVIFGIGCVLKGIAMNVLAVTAGKFSIQLLLAGLISLAIASIIKNGASHATGWASQATSLDYCVPLSIAFCVVAFLAVINILQLFLSLFVGERAAANAVGGILTSTIVGIYMWLLYKPIKKIATTLRGQWRNSAGDD